MPCPLPPQTMVMDNLAMPLEPVPELCGVSLYLFRNIVVHFDVSYGHSFS